MILNYIFIDISNTNTSKKEANELINEQKIEEVENKILNKFNANINNSDIIKEEESDNMLINIKNSNNQYENENQKNINIFDANTKIILSPVLKNSKKNQNLENVFTNESSSDSLKFYYLKYNIKEDNLKISNEIELFYVFMRKKFRSSTSSLKGLIFPSFKKKKENPERKSVLPIQFLRYSNKSKTNKMDYLKNNLTEKLKIINNRKGSAISKTWKKTNNENNINRYSNSDKQKKKKKEKSCKNLRERLSINFNKEMGIIIENNIKNESSSEENEISSSKSKELEKSKSENNFTLLKNSNENEINNEKNENLDMDIYSNKDSISKLNENNSNKNINNNNNSNIKYLNLESKKLNNNKLNISNSEKKINKKDNDLNIQNQNNINGNDKLDKINNNIIKKEEIKKENGNNQAKENIDNKEEVKKENNQINEKMNNNDYINKNENQSIENININNKNDNMINNNNNDENKKETLDDNNKSENETDKKLIHIIETIKRKRTKKFTNIKKKNSINKNIKKKNSISLKNITKKKENKINNEEIKEIDYNIIQDINAIKDDNKNLNINEYGNKKDEINNIQ